MKKNKLKSGMVVEYRDGSKRLVIDNDLIGFDGYSTLLNYNDDLKYKESGVRDIIKVYEYKYCMTFHNLLDNGNLDLIWEREEIKLTDKEIEILKALKTLGCEFLARDDNGRLFAYDKKPKKDGDDWINDGYHFFIKDIKLFNFIKWEDKEPANIDDLLKEIEK